MNVQDNVVQAFGRNIGNDVVYIPSRKLYSIIGVSGDGVEVKAKTGRTFKDHFYKFRIVVEDEQDARIREIPAKFAAQVVVNYETIGEETHEEFLRELMRIVYEMHHTNRKEQWDLRHDRSREYVEMRHVIMAVYFTTFEYTLENDVTLQQAADLYEKDHASVYNSINRVNAWLDTERSFREKYKEVWDLSRKIAKVTRLHI